MKPDYSDTKIGNLNKAFIVNSATNQPEFVADLFYPFWAVLRKSFIYSVLRNNGWSLEFKYETQLKDQSVLVS